MWKHGEGRDFLCPGKSRREVVLELVLEASVGFL